MRYLLLAATLLNIGQAAEPANDFAFRFEYGRCTTDVLDTFQGVFMSDSGVRGANLSIPLTIPPDSLRAVYQAITAAQFFQYPSDFRVKGNTRFGPSNHYRLEVRNAGLEHVVSWRDNSAPSTDEANRLRDMFSTITRVIRSLPQAQSLPVANVGCA